MKPLALPKLNGAGVGLGAESLPKPPKPGPLCDPNPLLEANGGALFGAGLGPKLKGWLLAPVKELAAVPLLGPFPPPRIGLASILSSSSVFPSGVVGPVGKTRPDLFEGGKENPPVGGALLGGASWPNVKGVDSGALPFGVASPGAFENGNVGGAVVGP